jgi:hypothetical protein
MQEKFGKYGKRRRRQCCKHKYLVPFATGRGKQPDKRQFPSTFTTACG